MANMMEGSMYRHRTYCYSGNQTAINTRYFLVYALAGSPVSEISVLTSIDTTAASQYKPCLANVAQYVGSDIQNITGARPYPVAVGTNVNIGLGTGGTLPIPGQVSGIYTLLTLYAGRGYRGRSYIPFPPSGASTTTTPPSYTGAYQANLASIASTFSGVINFTAGGSTYTIQWGIVHQSPAGVKGTFTASTSYRVGINWATQKRRGDFGRTNPSPTP